MIFNLLQGIVLSGIIHLLPTGSRKTEGKGEYKGRREVVSMRSDKFIQELKEVLSYLEEFHNRPHKLAKKLLLLLIQDYHIDR